MSSAARVAPPVVPRPPAQPRIGRAESSFRFQSLVLTEPQSLAKARGTTLSVSLLVHSVLIMAILVLPLLWEDVFPAPGNALRAFFVTPAELAPAPPPPPPPASGVRRVTRAQPAPSPPSPARFVAPVEVPSEVKPDTGLDVGVEGGVPGGVEGGVPGGVVGGVIGGLPQEAPPPPRVVRVGGQIVAPKVVYQVAPEYPQLAKAARLFGPVILEALVDVHGNVKTVTVLRGIPFLDEAALAAVRQWRYRPLLLNGEPTEFILTVTVVFSLTPSGVDQ